MIPHNPNENWFPAEPGVKTLTRAAGFGSETQLTGSKAETRVTKLQHQNPAIIWHCWDPYDSFQTDTVAKAETAAGGMKLKLSSGESDQRELFLLQ